MKTLQLRTVSLDVPEHMYHDFKLMSNYVGTENNWDSRKAFVKYIGKILREYHKAHEAEFKKIKEELKLT